jgi:ubiquinol-cytochrome c reductase cytochrome b subunit
VGIVALTYLAIEEDRSDPTYNQAVAEADAKAQRVVELIRGHAGIGAAGARALLHDDPKTQGPEIFARNCSACHRFEGHDGTGKTLASPATASDLGEFGTREWIHGFITDPKGPNYFGATERATFKGEPVGTRFTEGEMAGWAAENVSAMTKQEIDGVVEFLLAQSKRTDIPPPDPELVKIGREFWVNGSDEAQACSKCHGMTVDGEQLSESAGEGYPDLTGYASEEWLRQFLLDPGAERNYYDNNAMPSYKDRMSDKDLELLLRWMRHRWYEPGQDSEG